MIAVIALVAAGCGGGGSDTNSTAADGGTQTTETSEITLPVRPPSDYAGFAAQPAACGAEAPDPVVAAQYSAAEDQGLAPDQMVSATISTSCGDISIELDPVTAPETVNSFVFLARSGFFDGSVSHRIAPGFVIQAGDQTATGRGGPGYTIPDEFPEDGFPYTAGVLAMANAGPNSTGSQFFIVLGDSGLNNDFSYFGNVTDGFDTLDRIAAIPLGPNLFGEVSVPLETLYINSVTIDE